MMAKANTPLIPSSFFQPKYTLRLKGRLFSLKKPVVMGILNMTPDSFYAGSRVPDTDFALERAGIMLEEGASILDIGGYSSRPGADDIPVSQEIDRVIPAIEQVKGQFPDAVISIDTFRAAVADAAVKAGADIINDISGGQIDPEMFPLVGQLKVPYILMHMKGTPQNMQKMAHYEHLLQEIMGYFHQKIFKLKELGCTDLILDLGFGFAKTIDHNYTLLKHFDLFNAFDLPLLAGLSRKSMIFKKLGTTPAEALNGTTALNTVALQKGASILRVHDVKAAKEIIELLYG